MLILYDKYTIPVINQTLEPSENVLNLNNVNCYERYDGESLIGYHLDLTECYLKIGKDREFIKTLLNDLKYNIDNFDTWISKNENMDILGYLLQKLIMLITLLYYRDP